MEDLTLNRPDNAARNIAIAACALSAGVHAGLVPSHLAEEPKLGVAFALAAGWLVLLAVALGRSRRPAAQAAALLALLMVSYGASRTVGLPLAREHSEPVDALGVLTQAVQAIGLIAAVRLCEPTGAAVRLALRNDGP